mgnify:CR=1 FL=1
MIKIENLHKSFGKLEVLKGIDLEVKKGEIVVIIGSSGTGKSTLLRCLNYLEKPEEGKITIGDITVDAKTCDKKQVNELRKHSAMIFQNYNLFLNKNVLQNVMEPLVTAKKMNKNEAEKVAKHYLEQVGMSDKLKQYPATLSGGQQQRVALARMVAAHPGIFMFDEPMSALDSYLKSALEQNMLDLFDVCNRTVLYVSHDIDEACRLCQRICVMHDGHVEEIGSVEDVVRRPQPLAALRLTGCKNTSRARKIGSQEVEALDWGMTFNVGRAVPDNVAYLGIRASYFHVDNRAERGRNSYDLHVARVSDSRFERLVLLDVPRADAPTRLQWKVNKVGMPVDELPQAGETLRMHFDASKIRLVCR